LTQLNRVEHISTHSQSARLIELGGFGFQQVVVSLVGVVNLEND